MKYNRKGSAILAICMIGGLRIFAMDKPGGFFNKVKEKAKAVFPELPMERATQELRGLIDTKSKKISLKEVKKLVEAGANINVQNEQGTTVLALAAEQGNTLLVTYLLEKGANPNLAAPLVRAARDNWIAIVKQLIKAGANLNQYQDGHVTALYHATFNANPEMVALLLRAGADVNIQTASGNTPLHRALENFTSSQSGLRAASRADRISIIKMLLDSGADISLKNDSGETPLKILRGLKDEELTKLFAMQRKEKLP